MGLANFLINNSYSNIHGVNYCKHSLGCSFTLKTYMDSSKEVILSENFFNLGGYIDNLEVISKGVNTPPENPVIGDSYIIGDEPTGEWADFAGWSTTLDENGNWAYESTPNRFIYVADEDKYYSSRDDLTYVEAVNVFDSRMWNLHFAVDKIGGEGNDILKAIYTYLKTRPEFAGVSDS